MSRNHESFSPVMSKAMDVLSSLHELNGHENPTGHRAVEWRMLKHGRFEADVAGLYFQKNQNELAIDFEHYGEILGIEDIQLGLLLHDALGKPWVNQDARIWYTNARVNQEELDKIKHHHIIGYNRLYAARENIAAPIHQVVYDIALLHHEKRDGSGVLGNEWDTLPHVVQVATVIDQIISRCQPSPYRRRGFNLKNSITDVYKGYGIEYNPEVLDNLSEMFEANVHMQMPSLRWLGNY